MKYLHMMIALCLHDVLFNFEGDRDTVLYIFYAAVMIGNAFAAVSEHKKEHKEILQALKK